MEKQYRRPNSLDKNEFGSIWDADMESGLEVWVQSSNEIDNPKWVRLGELFEKNYHEAIYHECQYNILDHLLLCDK